MADRLDLAELEPTERPMIDALRRLRAPRRRRRLGASAISTSASSRATSPSGSGRRTPPGTVSARILLNISPYSAYAMGILIEAAWDQVKDEVPAWREKVGEAPALIAALGRKYAELKRLRRGGEVPEALHGALPRPLGLPSCWPTATRPGASSDRWQATLDEYLAKTEPAGLEHAKVQVDIANDLMKQRPLCRREAIRRGGGGDRGRLGDDLRLASATRD